MTIFGVSSKGIVNFNLKMANKYLHTSIHTYIVYNGLTISFTINLKVMIRVGPQHETFREILKNAK